VSNITESIETSNNTKDAAHFSQEIVDGTVVDLFGSSFWSVEGRASVLARAAN
jgi:hypothetical protein